MNHVQYFLSMADLPLTAEEYETFPAIDASQFVVVARANDRLLVRGIIDPEAPFFDIIAYLSATNRDPVVLMALNPDATDYCVNDVPLFDRDYEAYLAFFPLDEEGNRASQNTGGGWLLPGDVTETPEIPE